MTGEQPVINRGLEGVYFAESAICKVDGQAGKLYYRGYPIEALCQNSSYEEVSYLLIYGKLPTQKEFTTFLKTLSDERELPPAAVELISKIAEKAHPMDTLRTAVSMLSSFDTEAYDSSPGANLRKSIRLIAKSASIVAATGRIRSGGGYISPDPKLGHIENFLYMLTGKKPTEEETNILDTMFILHAEHSSNASTFGALVAGSTLSDMYASVTAGIAVLKGPLHGGADEAALRMMRNIATPDNTEKYIQEALAGKQKIMGFGHRVYKTYDPRARIVRKYLEGLQASDIEELGRLSQIALRAEKLMIEKLGESKGIWPNIDFFAGPVYTSIGIPIEIFTPIFAASRMSGWCAHLIEYWKDNRIIRPLEEYTGPLDVPYVPMDQRQ